MKPSGIVSFYNVPADAEDPDVKVYVNNELVESGGGGSSDLSFCNLTIGEDFDRTPISLTLPYLSDLEGSEALVVGTQFNTGVYKIPLYKGVCVGSAAYTSITATGDVVYDGGALIITGDCEITGAE